MIVEILPFIEESALYGQFDLKKTALNQNATTRPEEQQPSILLCPSDSARNRFYFSSGRRFAKGNYVCYVSPEHTVSMRCFPGAMINEPQPLKRFIDGTSKTLMLSEVRTREDENDERGVWAIGLNGGSIISFDMHSTTAGSGGVTGCDGLHRNTPYKPFDVGTPALPPNSPPKEETPMASAIALARQAACLIWSSCHAATKPTTRGFPPRPEAITSAA